MVSKLNIISKLSRKPGIALVVLLSIICLYVYRDFITLSKLYVYLDWGWDSYGSYWAWYAYLIDWANNGFPMWNFRVGIGASVFSASNFLFDPFNLLYILSTKGMSAYLLSFVFILKIILSGSFFYIYTKAMGFTKTTSLVVSLLYAFNGYLILWGQHYWFANIILYAPLMLYSLEQLIQRSKWILFSLVVGLTAIYSYYFLYMISIYLVLYAIARYILLYGFNLKTLMKFMVNFIFRYLLGVGLSAVVLFPSIYTALTNPRVGLKIDFSLNPASLIEYLSIFARPFSNDILGTNYEFIGYSNYYESPQLYCGLLTLLLIPQLIKILNKREKIIYGSLGGILACSILIPYGSVVFNAFSVLTYRWSFILIIFELTMMAFVLDSVFKDKAHVSSRILKQTFGVLCKTLVCLFVLTVVYKIIKNNMVISSVESLQGVLYSSIKPFILIVFFLCLYYLITNLYSKAVLNKKAYLSSLIVIICLELALFSNITVNKREALDSSYINNRQGYFDYTSDVLNYLKTEDRSFYRLEKSYYSASPSEPLFQDYYGTTVYNSLNNPSYLNFLRTINASNARTNTIVDGFKDRIAIQTLLGVKYYINKDQDEKPYGYSLLSKFGDLFLFQNDYYLPIGFSYKSYITEEDFSNLSIEEKDSVLLKYAIINESILPETHKHLDKYDLDSNKPIASLSEVELDFSQMTAGSNMEIIEQQGQSVLKYVALDHDPMFFVPLKEPIIDSKLMIKFEITSANPTSGQIFYTSAPSEFAEGKSKKFSISQGTSIYEVDMGYVSADQIRIDVGELPGEYTIKDIQLKTTSAADYVNTVEDLRKESLHVDYVSDDLIKGNINVSDDKLLFLSIPHNKGWRVYVDDVEQTLVSVNAGLSGVFLEKGEHEIKVKYSQPGLMAGGIVSGISIVLLISLIYLRKKRTNRNGGDDL